MSNIAQSELKFRCLYDANVIGIFMATDDGRITEANGAFLRLIGATAEDLEAGSLNWRELTPPELHAADTLALHRLQAEGRIPPYEKQFYHRDGHRVDVLVGAGVLSQVKDIYCVAYVVDLSQSKAQDLACRRKNEFLANTSHELRTPLNTIISASTTCLEGMFGPLNGKVAEYFELIRHNGEHLLRLINDILDLSRIEAGKLTLRLQPVGIRQLLEESARLVRPLMDAKGQFLVINIKRSCPAAVTGDSHRLRQVLGNLLSNAHKFSPSGSTVFLCARLDLSGKQLLISVRDEGPGVSPEESSRIFQPFERGGDPHEEKGTGLGLPLARRLAEAHAGSLTVESWPGKGSEFTLRLPLEAAKPVRQETPALQASR